MLQSQLQTDLQSLRTVLVDQGAAREIAWFDEFIQHNEWELALHVVCDYLLEDSAPRASSDVIRCAQTLHDVMEIEDACVSNLKKKAE